MVRASLPLFERDPDLVKCPLCVGVRVPTSGNLANGDSECSMCGGFGKIIRGDECWCGRYATYIEPELLVSFCGSLECLRHCLESFAVAEPIDDSDQYRAWIEFFAH